MFSMILSIRWQITYVECTQDFILSFKQVNGKFNIIDQLHKKSHPTVSKKKSLSTLFSVAPNTHFFHATRSIYLKFPSKRIEEKKQAFKNVITIRKFYKCLVQSRQTVIKLMGTWFVCNYHIENMYTFNYLIMSFNKVCLEVNASCRNSVLLHFRLRFPQLS